MHIPKTLPLFAAAIVAFNLPSAFAKDTDEAAKLREALRQKMAETQGAKPAPAPAATAAPAKPAATPASATTKPAVKPAPTSQPAPAAKAASADSVEIGDSPEDAALREALRAHMADQPPAATAAPAKAPAKAAAFEPLQAPPSPLTGSKEERLKQLLDQYKADQITPGEYHKQRAAIVAD